VQHRLQAEEFDAARHAGAAVIPEELAACVRCDKCGGIEFRFTGLSVDSMPAQLLVKCVGCGAEGYMLEDDYNHQLAINRVLKQ
jgi:hypothetical protein